MSDINKNVAMPAEENLDGESVSGQASPGTGEAGGIAATEERREEEEKGEGEEEEKDEGDPARIERGIMAHPASGIEYTARHSIFSCWLVVHFSIRSTDLGAKKTVIGFDGVYKVAYDTDGSSFAERPFVALTRSNPWTISVNLLLLLSTYSQATVNFVKTCEQILRWTIVWMWFPLTHRPMRAMTFDKPCRLFAKASAGGEIDWTRAS